MPGDSETVYSETRLEKSLQRPPQLERLTYSEFFRCWHLATSAEQQKASDAAAEVGAYSVTRKGADDFASYMDTSRCLQSAEHSLCQLLNGCTYSCEDGDDVALVKSMGIMMYPKL